MAPYSGELWGFHFMPEIIEVDCLMPNGVIVQLRSYRESPLEEIKTNLWNEAKFYPLFHILHDPAHYIFVSVTQDAEREEFYDESRRLCDLRLFSPVLRLVEPKGNKEEKMLNSDISIALGLPLHDFDAIAMNQPEVCEFRRHLVDVSEGAVEQREQEGFASRSLYVYPPEVENGPELPPSMKGRLDKGFMNVAVWSRTEANTKDKQMYTVAVHHLDPPEKIVKEVLLKQVRTMKNKYETPADGRRAAVDYNDEYVLKVAGTDQFFLQQCPISQYKHIRKCLAKRAIPQLMIMSRDGLRSSLPNGPDFSKPSYMRKTVTLPNVPTLNLWRLDKHFSLHVLAATYVNVKDGDSIYVRLGVYHGTEALCQVRQSQVVLPSKSRWDERIVFDDLFTLDLPRAAKVCTSICAVKRRKNRDETTMLCWGNFSLFDWRSHLLSGNVSLNLWSVPRGLTDDLLNPLGIVGSNPAKESSPCLELMLDGESSTEAAVAYPTLDDFKEYAQFTRDLGAKATAAGSNVAAAVDITADEKAQLVNVSQRDPLAEISEQEKVMLWRLRQHCLGLPDILPRFLDAVKWNSRDDLTQLYLLLEQWPAVSPQTALELLDCKYADPTVRRKAVEWLDEMSDEDLAQYLMQLVQTLKYEPYLNNPLSNLLLRRALLNRKIGHFFFWHLRSELQAPALCVRFGLMLEAFCRGLGRYFLKQLNKQVDALDKLTKLTESLKDKYQQESAKERMKYMLTQLRQADFMESLQYFQLPLDITILLGSLEIEQCKVMDSAKKPLWLVWKNPDEMSDRLPNLNAVIFKNGDDLRQDMLTLQVISVMDHIWHMEGLDLRMTPYTCLATGPQVGMIQVVRDAKTVYQIQRKASKLAAMQVDSTQLFKWIRENNKPDLGLAIETFTLSCAGYCVATFILGIGDRHPDNIMVNKDGQIFHIDFGHFLGHFKKKFGINRERVPFVLTEDFLLVISNGKEYPRKSEEFAKFQELCGKAYLALRKHSNLLITLFTMMLPTGITELQTINDVGYLRQTLAVEKTDEEALKYFQAMFYDAYGGAWTTKLDWFFHSVRHGV